MLGDRGVLVFSSRLTWDVLPNALSSLLAAKRAARRPYCDLTVSNPTDVGLPYPADELAAAFARAELASYTPSARGPAAVRELIAARSGAAVDDLILCASTSEAYGWLFKLLCDPGDAVLAPEPSYPLFEYLAGLEGVTLRRYPLVYDGEWHIDFPSLAQALDTPRTRAVLVVNPNNPTGSYLSADEATRLNEMCAAAGAAIVSDEVFADYPADDAPSLNEFRAAPTHVTCAAARAASALTFSLGGLSKGSGLPQMKLGWIAAGGPAELRRAALERLDTIADSYLSVGAPVLAAAPRLLEIGDRLRAAIAARVRKNRAWLAGAVARDGVPALLPAQGGWYAVLRFPDTRTDEELALELLDKHDVLAHPGYFFDFPSGSYLVVSLLVPEQALQWGVEAILQLRT